MSFCSLLELRKLERGEVEYYSAAKRGGKGRVESGGAHTIGVPVVALVTIWIWHAVPLAGTSIVLLLLLVCLK